jgi:hypothetical protein
MVRLCIERVALPVSFSLGILIATGAISYGILTFFSQKEAFREVSALLKRQ